MQIIAILALSFSTNTNWLKLSDPVKNYARNWFVKRAETKGIPWTERVNYHTSKKDLYYSLYKSIENETINYPYYYTMPFHGYDQGNLNWDAAYEIESSTMSMTSNYWENTDYATSSKYTRNNFTTFINKYIGVKPKKILDVGCSTGISTSALLEKFTGSEMHAVDLSPYFLSIAKNCLPNVELLHANAENMPYKSNTFDIVCLSYILHEVPITNTLNIIKECHRILKPNGTIAIVDLDPEKLNLYLQNPFRKWAFDSTEPHIQDFYNTNLSNILLGTNFDKITLNDLGPLNTIILASK